MTQNQLFQYTLQLADNALILGQRLSEWCGHGPAVEEDIALTNTALDLLGQATNLFKYAAEVEGMGRNEDQLAFLREATEYSNLLLLELPNGDYAKTIARQFFFSTWYYLYLRELAKSHNEFLKGFAEKSIKEVKYHWQHSSDWVKRMGDGTEESHKKIQNAIDEIWDYTGEMFLMSDVEQIALQENIGVDNTALKSEWRTIVESVLDEATLLCPEEGWTHKGGKQGKHTEHIGFILAEMQYLPKTYPDAKW